jgi:hypothetical protein
MPRWRSRDPADSRPLDRAATPFDSRNALVNSANPSARLGYFGLYLSSTLLSRASRTQRHMRAPGIVMANPRLQHSPQVPFSQGKRATSVRSRLRPAHPTTKPGPRSPWRRGNRRARIALRIPDSDVPPVVAIAARFARPICARCRPRPW